jgi:triosephosphate isomerase
MSRTTWILGNWKQNHLRAEAAACARALSAGLEPVAGLRVGIAPTFLALDAVSSHCSPEGLMLLAQDVAAQDAGAHTGEVGPAMLQECGVEGAIVGHSERRAHFGDTNELVKRKANAALEAGFTVVLCVGEPLEVRESGEHESHVISQLSDALSDVDPELPTRRLVVAYEPIWAIGTGRTASPDQADEMHGCIRRWMRDVKGAGFADRSVLYGGSVKPGNAGELIARPEIDGFLVGGASLDAESFLAIVAAANPSPRS